MAVFAPACVELAYSLGFDDVRMFRDDGGGKWTEVAT